MFYSLSAIVFAVVVVAACGFAFAKGGRTERVFAAAYMISWLAVLACQAHPLFDDLFPWIVFGIDIALLGVYAALAWRGPSWVVWATALQALGVASHIMNLFVVAPSVDAFYTVINLIGYGSMIALAVGTFWAWQERKASGVE